MLLAVIILAAVVVLMAVLLLTPGRRKESSLLIKADIDRLSGDIAKLKDTFNTQIDKSQSLMVNSLQKQFSESAKLISDVTKSLTELKESNKQVVNITDELKTLQNVLQNPKQRGVLGEYYLQTVLENVLPPDQYKLQQKIGKDDNGNELVPDAVILLDRGLMLPVDAKFSLENYNRLIEERNPLQREVYAKQFRLDLKARIDETAKYIRPNNGTMDFAFMFIPSEAIYYDLLINKVGSSNIAARDLIEYAFRDKNVIIVSPTSFLAYLQTVLQGLRSLHIEEQAKQIQTRVGDLGRHINNYQNLMIKLGNSLGTTVGHFNSAHKELAKVDKDVLKITGSHAHPIEPFAIDKPSNDNES
ncbi:DNA recombination protein RmuC [Patescibacteria group bacterium]|nr:DNA recombination protein RmuC [Patescibacteria group bacterium]